MARKSNKTAHVLNLLSGQSANEEPEKEIEQPQEEKKEEKVEVEAKVQEAAADTVPAPAPAPVKAQAVAPSPEVPANISIIDNAAKEADPIAERIHEELLKELTLEENSSSEEQIPEAEAISSTVAAEPKAETSSSTVAVEPEAETSSSAVAEETKVESPALQEPEEEVLDLSSESPAAPEPPVEPEPDYVMLNVMQRVVEDKIIYFMKQFEVCTCDRCKADTIALTLSGLPAKYRIVDKNAVDPLVSYYTNRLISQVTVEALKACTQVKDNPRH